MRVTFTPNLPEHLRARRAMGRVAPVFDPRGRLPRYLVALLLSNLIIQAVRPDAEPWMVGMAMFGFPALFFTGIGLRNLRGEGKRLTIDFGGEAIELAQPRHRWSVPWARVARVDETAEFFLVATPRVAFYLPKRALGGPEGEATLRQILHARAGGGRSGA